MKRLIYPLLAAILLAVAPGPPPASDLTPAYAAREWLNGPIHPGDTLGRVVVVDVFTVDCVNCRNVVPTLRALYREDRLRGLRIVGVHAPETPAEKQRAYVAANLKAQGIVWPVAIDDDFKLWNAYGVDAWPTELFFDRHGRLRKIVVGDSQDEAVRSTVKTLLAERS